MILLLRKCIKCGDTNAQYYSGSGNTCKECCKKYQKVRFAQKELVTKEDSSKAIMDNYRSHKWGGGASVWVNEVQVMEGGLLIGQEGRDWWQQKKVRHEKWLRRKRKKENAITALPAQELSIEVPQ